MSSVTHHASRRLTEARRSLDKFDWVQLLLNIGSIAIAWGQVWVVLAGLIAVSALARRFEDRSKRRVRRQPRRTNRGPESPLEHRFLELVGEAGLTRPETQYLVPAGGHEYRLEFAYPSLKLAAELDGRYHQQRERREWDAQRDAALLELGWRTVRLRNGDIEGTPQSVMSMLTAAGVTART